MGTDPHIRPAGAGADGRLSSEIRLAGAGADGQPNPQVRSAQARADGRLSSQIRPAAVGADMRLGSEEFLTAFDAFAQAVRRARGASVQNADRDLTLSQYALLEPLTERQAARVQELAADAGIAPPTATRILDALERRGIVRRTRSSEDRRGVTVTLTQAGREALGSQAEWLRSRQHSFFSSLPPDERELAPDLLMRLAGLIDELAAGPPSH